MTQNRCPPALAAMCESGSPQAGEGAGRAELYAQITNLLFLADELDRTYIQRRVMEETATPIDLAAFRPTRQR